MMEKRMRNKKENEMEEMRKRGKRDEKIER